MMIVTNVFEFTLNEPAYRVRGDIVPERFNDCEKELDELYEWIKRYTPNAEYERGGRTAIIGGYLPFYIQFASKDDYFHFKMVWL